MRKCFLMMQMMAVKRSAQIGEPEVSPTVVAAPANESVEKLALPSVDTVESIQEEASDPMILTVEAEQGDSSEDQPAQNVIKRDKRKICGACRS